MSKKLYGIIITWMTLAVCHLVSLFGFWEGFFKVTNILFATLNIPTFIAFVITMIQDRKMKKELK